MNDRIKVKRIAVHAYHGALPEEAVLGQKFLISLAVDIDLSKAGHHDDLMQTISYARLVELVQNITATKRFRLIEALAETIADTILSEFSKADAVTVEIEKPSAPIAAILDTVSVEIFRKRVIS